MKSNTCCPNPGAAIRCSACRRQQRWHAYNCPETPLMAWHTKRGAWLCDPCWSDLPGRPSIPTAIRRAVIQRDGMVCRLCSREVVLSMTHRPDRLHLDHIIQWAEGGEHSVENLRVTCADCNMRRARLT